jgi:hypothetical protein
MRKTIIVFSLLFLFSCKRERPCDCELPYQSYYLKAEVIQTSDMNCGRPVVSFAEDAVRIRMITGLPDLHYIAAGLPADFNQLNRKLYINTGLLKPDEEFSCAAYGPSYAKIKVLEVKPR